MNRTKSLVALCGIAVSSSLAARAQGQGSTIEHGRPAHPDGPDVEAGRPRARMGLGLEADVVPYILSGAHVDGWVGMRGWRTRAIAVTFTAPSFFTPDGFDNLHTTLFEVELDRFFGPHADEFRGPWVAAGGGLELLAVDASDGSAHGSTSAFELSTGVGWSFPLAFNAYVDPWVGAAYAFTPTAIAVGTHSMQTARFSPQLGLKIGWHLIL
jgi:hypothetical protein